MNLIEILENPPKRPINIRQLIRSLGLKLDEKSELPRDIVGQITQFEDTYLISVKPDDHDYRKRFTMAHELGHWFLHRSLIGDGVTDTALYRNEDWSQYNQTIQVIHERQANGFAANLLMPEGQFREDHKVTNQQEGISQNRKTQKLYHAYKVSPKAMEMRMRQLELSWS